MRGLHVHLISSADIEDLRSFEFENRGFFESQVNARPAAFYASGGVERSVDAAVADAQAGLAFQYLVRDDVERLVGRVNLHHVRRAQFQSAELGYRVGLSMTGQGAASEAVRLALAQAFDVHSLRRIEAAVRTDHIASIKVLEKHGFVTFGRSRRSFELGGVWHDRLHLELHAENSTSSNTD